MRKQKGVQKVIGRIRAKRLLAMDKEELDDMPGIYAVYNSKTQNYYIGRTKNLLQRKKSHFELLQRGKHFNQHLQRSYDLYGAYYFKFIVIEYIDPEDGIDELIEREWYWIDELKPQYNIYVDEFSYNERFMKKSDPVPDIDEEETFKRPVWHTWVYGGSKNPLN